MTADTSEAGGAPRVAPVSLHWKDEKERRGAEVARLAAALGMERAPHSVGEVGELGLDAPEELVQMRERLEEMAMLRPAALEQSWQAANDGARASRQTVLEQLRT